MTAFSDPAVERTFEAYPERVGRYLADVRERVFRLAKEDAAIGSISEELKWGEPSYLTRAPKSGTTLRLAWSNKSPHTIGLMVHCQTTLVAEFSEMYPEQRYDGNRGLLLPIDQNMPTGLVESFVQMALTYHSRKSVRPA